MEKILDMIQCLKQRQNGSRVSDYEYTVKDESDYVYCEIPPETPRQLHERMIASGFPAAIADLTFDKLTVDANNSEEVQKAKEFAQDPRGGLYICGTFGTGKTWLAAAVANEVAQQVKRVRFGTFSGIADRLIDAQKRGDYSEKWDDYVYRPDLLIVDDIGKEKPTDWKLQTLFRLIDERISACLPTVLTSNYNLSQLCERISPNGDDGITAGAIIDRLTRFTPLTLTGESRR